MTGHGRGAHEHGGRRATVELRAVNHRFFDLKVRAPFTDPALEAEVERALRKRAQRGAISVLLRQEGAGDAGDVRVDLAVARKIAAALEEVRAALGLEGGVPLALVAAQPGVLVVGEAAGADNRWSLFEPAVAAALGELETMRAREGAALARDLTDRLTRLETIAGELGRLAGAAPADAARRLGERVAKLIATTGVGASVDPQRLELELALLADRQDVTEELVRLASHLAQARALLLSDEPVGRKLDFLIQELGREINTIGSKSQTAELARLIVEAKAELERVREQVQNVE